MLVSKINPYTSMHGQYNATAKSSLNQLQLLWSFDYCNWITISYTNHCLNLFFVFKCAVSLLHYVIVNVNSCITYVLYNL